MRPGWENRDGKSAKSSEAKEKRSSALVELAGAGVEEKERERQEKKNSYLIASLIQLLELELCVLLVVKK